uniref:CD72 molecule n=1 Tax=Urocitellus parryii TaxID=9999 RepID=A0A8D2I4R6_UROPR
MADAITYADLRFVKAPLKKIVSSQLGEDPEAYEDGELTYENVQVPSVPGGPSGLASSGLGDKSDLQVSQKLQQVSSVLEDTNSSLQEQLHLRITQLEQKEENLQESKRKLAQSQEVLQVAQENRQAAEGKLKDCQLDKEKTQETLQREEDQRRALQERLHNIHNMQDTLKPFFTCSPQGHCCPVGWTLKENRCFYFSSTRQTWEESQNYCKSLSSNLATFSRRDYSVSIPLSTERRGIIQKGYSWWYTQSETCTSSLPFICEQSSFRFPDGDHSLQ